MLRATSSTEAAWSRLPTRDTIERAAASPLVEGRLISVNVAILGYGAIAREHALALNRIGPGPTGMRVNLTAVMGRLPAPTRAFAEEFGATRATTDLDELLADPHVEAVLVCSPSDVHAEQTERALRAGKHVLCEIPWPPRWRRRII
jgi:2-hydroxy-4-carboxymuconate semialdehyde hemiacetal dehydrogenase